MCCALVAFFALNQQTAHANEILISGTTTGSFSNGNTSLLGLTFNSGSFSGTTSGNALVFDAVNNLGSFTLNALPGVYDNNFFTLQVMITSPGGIFGGNSQSITGFVLGSVITDTNGLVGIDFGSGSTLFSFDNGSEAGVLALSIDPIVFNLGTTTGAMPLTGSIVFVEVGAMQTIPEPTTLLLLGTGLAGVIAKVRRRSKSKLNDSV
jgi:hypothetical protein